MGCGQTPVKISDKGLALIKSFEGCRLQAYPDPGTGGDPWTIGYGHTGPEVTQDLAINQQEADEFLERDVARFEECVTEALINDATQEQFDAMVCFAFNVGCKAFAGSTLLRLMNAGDAAAAAQQFARWDKANGRVMAGLTRRRTAERDLFLS